MNGVARRGHVVAQVLSAAHLLSLFDRHRRRFNYGVRTGDFSAMLDMYDSDAVFELADPLRITHCGLDAIRRAYRGDPPKGTMQLRGPRIVGQTVTADYIWDAEPDRIAGQFTLEFTGAHISRSLVTFAPD
jgi:hypothetical protein